jgi:pterin-4a-carbinolamine dehydratase
MDVEAIRVSDDWAQRIQTALNRATVLIVVIGPHWLRIADEYGRRRLDKEDDWVRNEIRHALDRKIPVLPVLLTKTPFPEKTALPEPIGRLSERQAFDLRDDRWENDIAELVSRVEALGFRRRSDKPIRYPKPRVHLAELSPGEMEQALRQLPEWEVVTSELPGREPQTRAELKRVYEFRSFEDSVAFMASAAKHISDVQHHPRWENLWRTITVWLTTWDIGQRPSILDVQLAHHLDEMFVDYLKSTSAEPKRSS